MTWRFRCRELFLVERSRQELVRPRSSVLMRNVFFGDPVVPCQKVIGHTLIYQDPPTGHHLRLLSLQKPPEETCWRVLVGLDLPIMHNVSIYPRRDPAPELVSAASS